MRNAAKSSFHGIEVRRLMSRSVDAVFTKETERELFHAESGQEVVKFCQELPRTLYGLLAFPDLLLEQIALFFGALDQDLGKFDFRLAHGPVSDSMGNDPSKNPVPKFGIALNGGLPRRSAPLRGKTS